MVDETRVISDDIVKEEANDQGQVKGDSYTPRLTAVTVRPSDPSYIFASILYPVVILDSVRSVNPQKIFNFCEGKTKHCRVTPLK